MNEELASWWRARTPRERMLIGVAGWLAFIVAAPLVTWQTAHGYRADGEAALRRAQSLAETVAGLDPQLAALAPAERGSPQETVMRVTGALGLTVAQLEEIGPARIRIRFGPSDSLAVLQFIDQVTRAGLKVDRSALVRADETSLVQAELELSGQGS
jgi:type II secretory pathway component PulM